MLGHVNLSLFLLHHLSCNVRVFYTAKYVFGGKMHNTYVGRPGSLLGSPNLVARLRRG